MDLHTVTLESFAYGGDAFGRLPDGRAVFVPYGIPGETVQLSLVEEKRNFARGEVVEVLQAASERITPRCAHHFVTGMDKPACGGCHYQMLPYEKQLAAKAEILRDQLQRIGRMQDPPVQPTVPSPQPWNYRNHVQFHPDEGGRLGFVSTDAGGILALSECHLPETELNLLWPQLEFDPIPGLERISLRAGSAEDIMLILESSDPEPVELELELPISVVHLGPGGTLVLAGDDHLVTEVHERPFKISAGSFFQVNTAQAEQMVTHLLEHVKLGPDCTAIDAYCGVGLFSAFLAPQVGRLISIESSASACEDFVDNLDEFDNVELYEAEVAAVLPALDVKPELILVDPPRAGLGPRTLDAILALQPKQLAYISCDPATFARDARRLSEGGYRLLQVTPFDLFPQTYHIESISFWEGVGSEDQNKL